MILQLRFSNSDLSEAARPSSVVQTGVKSLGWLKSTAQEFPFQCVEGDRSLGGVGGEIGRGVSEADGHVVRWG